MNAQNRTALQNRSYLSAATLALAGVFLLAVAARVLPGPRTIDDAYITFRYARNLLAGEGFVYNPGERVLGTTTPLYTLLLVLLGSLTGGVNAPFPILALAANALSDGIACLLLAGLGRRLGAPRSGLAAALAWAVAPFSVTFAIGGLETSLYVLLLLGTASAHLGQRRLPAAVLGALTFLTRPDALILLGPLALDRVWQALQGRRVEGRHFSLQTVARSLLPELLACALPALGWLGFATLYFGSPFPHSIAAKTLAYRLPPEAALVRLLQHYATPFLEHLTFGAPAIAVGLVLYLFLSILGARRALRRAPHAWPFLAYPWLYFTAFALANPLIFRWYLTPPLPFYFLGILIGLEALGEAVKPKQLPALARAVPLMLALLLALSLRGWELHPAHGLQRPAPEMAWYELELLYRHAAGRLAPELAAAPPGAVLAAGDVGVLGFFTGARILDTVGLNSPISTQYYPLDPDLYAINYAVPPGLILDQRPDFIVILEVYGRKGLLKEGQFWEAYDLLETLPADIYGSEGMLIFRRKS